MELEIREANIRGLPIYECSACGKKAYGSTVRLSLHTVSDAVLKEAIANIHPSHMPVGWCSNGRVDYRCSEHITGEQVRQFNEKCWLTRFEARLRKRGIAEKDIRFIVDADGAEAHLDTSPEEAADAEITQLGINVLPPVTESTPLKWDDVANIYDRYNVGRKARTLPVETVFDWVKGRTDLVEFNEEKGTLHAVRRP
jgi:hypothetical protein